MTGCSIPSWNWDSTAPISTFEGSVCKTNVVLKFGACKMGLQQRDGFSSMKARSASLVHLTWFGRCWRVNSVRGAAFLAKQGMNVR